MKGLRSKYRIVVSYFLGQTVAKRAYKIAPNANAAEIRSMCATNTGDPCFRKLAMISPAAPAADGDIDSAGEQVVRGHNKDPKDKEEESEPIKKPESRRLDRTHQPRRLRGRTYRQEKQCSASTRAPPRSRRPSRTHPRAPIVLARQAQ